MVVCLDSIKHDERYFALGLAVEEVIVAPEGFEEKVPITLKCVWNHPYMSMGADLISAPYSFYLHFGAQGVQRVRELSATRFFDKLRDSPMALGVLRASFESDIQVPGELSDDDNG